MVLLLLLPGLFCFIYLRLAELSLRTVSHGWGNSCDRTGMGTSIFLPKLLSLSSICWNSNFRCTKALDRFTRTWPTVRTKEPKRASATFTTANLVFLFTACLSLSYPATPVIVRAETISIVLIWAYIPPQVQQPSQKGELLTLMLLTHRNNSFSKNKNNNKKQATTKPPPKTSKPTPSSRVLAQWGYAPCKSKSLFANLTLFINF